jgi:ribose/xylose/arabinose/galactoside ABC-type transport system permease subunit
MDDPDAAELSGVNVKMMLISGYAIADLIWLSPAGL